MSVQIVLGHACLDISAGMYCFWLLPQTLMNSKTRNATGVSLLTTTLLTVGYVADFIYAIGRHMPFLYCLVSVFGLLCLFVQLVQRYLYHRQSSALITLGLGLIALYVGIHHSSKATDDALGFLSSVCWFSFLFPQMWHNYRRRSTRGFNMTMIYFSVIAGVCDFIAALCLGWDWPSLISPPLGLIKKAVILTQHWYYAKTDDARAQSLPNAHHGTS